MRVCPKCGVIYSSKPRRCGIDGEELVDSEEDPLIGRVLDRYRIIHPLGAGAMGCVYLAQHTVLDHEYAIKILFGELAADEKLVKRFTREAKYLSQINHKNVVKVVDFGTTTTGLAFLVMENLQGISLKELMEIEGKLTLKDIAATASQIAEGLGAVHNAGFVHRDIKPGNIMMVHQDGQDVAKVLDFGLVSIVDDDAQETKLTKTGQTVGTPTYMAPEQAKAGVIEPAADIYSLGIVMYEAFTGKVPFSGSSGEVLVKHIVEKVPPIPEASGFEFIIQHCLEKNPSDRPTIPALLELLAPWSGDNVLDSRASIPAISTVPLKRPLTDEAAFDSIALRTAPGISVQSSGGIKAQAPSYLPLLLVASALVITALAFGFLLRSERANVPQKTVTSTPLEEATPVGAPAEAAPNPPVQKESDKAVELKAVNSETKALPMPVEQAKQETRSAVPIATPSASEKTPIKVVPKSPKRPTKRKRTKPKNSAPIAKEKPSKSEEKARPASEVIPPPKEKLSPGKVNVVAVYDKRPRPVEIFVNGKPKGTTPMRLILSPGLHIIEIRPVGLPAQKREITVESGRNSPIVFNLSQ